jgi:hypothetical protein
MLVLGFAKVTIVVSILDIQFLIRDAWVIENN